MHATLSTDALGAAPASADQQRRLDARRDFVAQKLAYMRASDDVTGALGVLLQRRVRAARHADELWPLRQVLLGSLPARNERCALHHMALHAPCARDR